MENIHEYILNNFAESDLSPAKSYIFSKYHLRFELGDNLKNGSKKRVKQSVLRATTLFEAFFEPNDEIWILINSWKSRNSSIKKAFRPTESYLEDQFADFDLINKVCIEETIEEFDEALNEETNLMQMKDFTCTYIQNYFKQKVSLIQYKSIIEGKANLEMGFKPSIGENVYFINPRNNVAFYIYDDRGCLLFSSDRETLKPTYVKYNQWLVDYHRATFDEMFS
jgi:Domain of unknown function (DUF3885)